MGMTNITFSTAAAALLLQARQAGDAAEMETAADALLAQIAGSGDGSGQLADLKLTGLGKGPGWMATFVFGDVPGPNGTAVSADASFVAAAVAGNPTEAYAKLLGRLAAINAATTIGQIAKVEIAGNGDGSRFMAACFGQTV